MAWDDIVDCGAGDVGFAGSACACADSIIAPAIITAAARCLNESVDDSGPVTPNDSTGPAAVMIDDQNLLSALIFSSAAVLKAGD
jgi:hypothetical protein